MRIYPWIFTMGLLISFSCGKSKSHEHNEESTPNNPNQALYDQVMDIHNEVMPRMEEIYQLKKQLKDKISTSDMTDSKKKELNQIILELDSADKSMMSWMHKFNPLPDSANQETAREYLEDQMEKIKQVKDLMNLTIQKAKDETVKN